MKNKLILGLIIAVILSTAPAPAFAWGSATHLYLSEKLGNKNGGLNDQEMYGATVLDVFNLMFGYEHQPYLWTETHYGFMKLVDAAEPEEKALVYGAVSHNEAWGADHTAHIDALTIEGDGGYVIIKSMELASILAPEIRTSLEGLILVVFGLDPDDYPDWLEELVEQAVEELSLVLADNGVESAVDYLITQNEDKKVGYRMLSSAEERDDFIPLLLSEAYAGGLAYVAEITPLEASAIIIGTESEFKEQMISYGTALTQENAMEIMAEQGAELAIMILEAEYGIEVPPDLYPQIFALVKNLMTFTLFEAIEIVEDDYFEELEATQKYVKKQLNRHKVKTYRKSN